MEFGINLEETSRALPGDLCDEQAAEPEILLTDPKLLEKFLSDRSGKFRLYVIDVFDPAELFRLLEIHCRGICTVMQASIKSDSSVTESVPPIRIFLKAFALEDSILVVMQHTDSRILSKLLASEVQKLLNGASEIVVLSSESVAEFRSSLPTNLDNKLFTVTNSWFGKTTEPASSVLPSPNVVKYGAAFFLTICEMVGKPSKALIHYTGLNEVPYELKAFSTFLLGCSDLKDLHCLLPKLLASKRMNPVLSSNLFV